MYLGLQIKQTESNLLLKQPNLTNCITNALGLIEAAAQATPVTGPLGKCKDKEPVSPKQSSC